MPVFIYILGVFFPSNLLHYKEFIVRRDVIVRGPVLHVSLVHLVAESRFSNDEECYFSGWIFLCVRDDLDVCYCPWMFR